MTKLSLYGRLRARWPRRRAASLAGTVLGVGIALLPGAAAAQDEIDAFMERVLEQREENWITLHEYVLDERETLELSGVAGIPLQGFDREYSWYVRDGYLIRSPVRFDGVEIGEAERREFEADWLRDEQRRVAGPRRLRRRRSARGSFENVKRTVEREWGRAIGDDLARQLATAAESRRDDFAAVVLGAPAIVDELGGVAAVGFDVAAARTRDAFVLIEVERLDAADVSPLLAEMLPRLAGAVGAADDAERDQLVELTALAERFLLEPAALDGPLDTVETALREHDATDRAERVAGVRRGLAGGPPTPLEAEEQTTPGEPSDLQPRFVSEAYFLDFEFEPGNYYFAGPDRLDGRDVVKIEYYPERLFSEEGASVTSDDQEDRIEAGFDKTSLVTLWVDPTSHQIVKFTFDNLGFEFLPGRWLVRLDDLTASMVMSQPIEDVWLPEAIEFRGQLSLATGTFTVTYTRAFSNYRRAETGARIRSYGRPGILPQ